VIALVFLPVLGGIICLVLKDRKSVSSIVAIVTALASGSVLPFVIFEDASIVLGNWGVLGIGLAIDELTTPFLLSTFIVMLAVILNSINKSYDGFFYALILILYGTLNSIFLSRDLFNIFVTVELASIISFILISYEKKPRQAWASLKYLLLSSLGLNFYLLGIGIVYMETGSFAMESLENASTISAVLIFGGLAVKSGLFFFSMWLPDAHSNAPIEVSPILSGLIVKLDVYLSIRFITYSSFSWMRDAYIFIGILSAIIGVIFAVNSKNAKRVLAYHTISQVGFMLVNCDKSSAWHGFSHAIFKTLLFLAVGNISARLGTKDYSKWSGKISTVEYTFLLIGSLAISGFPMTSGCVTKEVIIHGACCPSLRILLLIASVGTAMSFSKFIFLRPVKTTSWPAANVVAAYVILSGVIIAHGIIGFEIYMFESILPVMAGIAAYLILRRFLKPLPTYLERIDSSLSSYLLFFLITIGLAILFSS
jgi:multicomponent Na+:H+ antiporter subunit D